MTRLLLPASTFFCILATALSLKCHYHESVATYLPDVGQVGPTQVLIEDSVAECTSKDAKYCLSVAVSNVDENTKMEMRLTFRGCNGDPKYGVMKEDPASIIDVCTKNGVSQSADEPGVKGTVECCDKDECNYADDNQPKGVSAVRTNFGLALGIVIIVGVLTRPTF
ncbi:hypothetical protein AAVH_16193 [Aphelenchoides avenae]|nr:hypothetical protein AAVH_16193 [Aphelenchus avenae]